MQNIDRETQVKKVIRTEGLAVSDTNNTNNQSRMLPLKDLMASGINNLMRFFKCFFDRSVQGSGSCRCGTPVRPLLLQSLRCTRQSLASWLSLRYTKIYKLVCDSVASFAALRAPAGGPALRVTPRRTRSMRFHFLKTIFDKLLIYVHIVIAGIAKHSRILERKLYTSENLSGESGDYSYAGASTNRMLVESLQGWIHGVPGIAIVPRFPMQFRLGTLGTFKNKKFFNILEYLGSRK